MESRENQQNLLISALIFSVCPSLCTTRWPPHCLLYSPTHLNRAATAWRCSAQACTQRTIVCFRTSLANSSHSKSGTDLACTAQTARIYWGRVDKGAKTQRACCWGRTSFACTCWRAPSILHHPSPPPRVCGSHRKRAQWDHSQEWIVSCSLKGKGYRYRYASFCSQSWDRAPKSSRCLHFQVKVGLQEGSHKARACPIAPRFLQSQPCPSQLDITPWNYSIASLL